MQQRACIGGVGPLPRPNSTSNIALALRTPVFDSERRPTKIRDEKRDPWHTENNFAHGDHKRHTPVADLGPRPFGLIMARRGMH
jgi:hypothetical protein